MAGALIASPAVASVEAPPPNPAPVQELRLPALREDLKIAPGAGSRWGEPVWVVYDPLLHRYLQINDTMRAVLSVWREGATVAEMALAARNEYGAECDAADLTGLIEFCRANDWISPSASGYWRELSRRSELREVPLWRQLLHNYLFFKVPLLRPQPLLEAILPFIGFVFTWWMAAAVAATGVLGLYLTSRQWETFRTTFHDYATWEGAASFGLVLIVIKACHELGHAFTAVRFGCRVPTIGVAFMVLTPLLYTDVTDTWRLPDRRRRLLIDAAGVIVELGIACAATFLWAFLPDGMVRGFAFIAATSAWVVSLAVNVSPFMRFDGYYMLSDILGVDNLQPRAFALAKWKLRQILFAPRLRCPDPMPAYLLRTVLVYGFSVWLYRLVVFTGIAVLVYAMFFKALGIILFGVEIWYFVLGPIVTEIRQWRTMKSDTLSKTRVALTACAGLVILAALVFPWSARVEVPAVLEAITLVHVFPPGPGKVVSVDVRPGQPVEPGMALATLTSPINDNEIRATRIRIAATQQRIAQAVADAIDREELLVLTKDLESQTTTLQGLLTLRDQMKVRSPIAGQVVELNSQLPAERWIGKSEMIALVAGDGGSIVRGYLAEQDLGRLEIGAAGRFVPEDLTMASIPVHLSKVGDGGAATIDVLALASLHGGRVPAEQDARQKLVPVGAQFPVELAPETDVVLPQQVVRGLVVLSGSRESLMTRAWRQVSKVLIRESGF